MINIVDGLYDLGITGWSLDDNPTNVEEFNEYFSINIVNAKGDFELSRNPDDFGVTWDDLVIASKLAPLRKRRNNKLSDCDWVTLKSYSKGEAVPTEWAEYQQALRDITNNYSSLDDVVWPKKPT